MAYLKRRSMQNKNYWTQSISSAKENKKKTKEADSCNTVVTVWQMGLPSVPQNKLGS